MPFFYEMVIYLKIGETLGLCIFVVNFLVYIRVFGQINYNATS